MKSYVLKLLQLLDTSEFLSSKELARSVGKSPKTIQKQIKKLNNELEGIAQIESKAGQGYRLLKINEIDFLDFCYRYQSVPGDMTQRREYILISLLTHQYIKIKDLSQKLYINEKAISNDLKEIRELISEFDLHLISRPYHGLSLIGNEENIRFFILRHQLNFTYKFTDTQRQALYDYLSGFKFSPIYLYNIETMFGISLERIRLGYLIHNYDDSNVDEQLVQLIDAQWSEIPRNELGFLTHYIHRLKKEQKITIHEVDIRHGLYLIEATFGLKLVEDDVFVSKMVAHLTALKKRLDSHIYITNPLLEDIRKNLALEYNIAKHFSVCLLEHFQMQLTTDELGFLAIIFAFVTTKLKTLRKSILIVSNFSSNSYQLLESTYYHLFGEYVKKIESCSPQELLSKPLNEYDHIITINGLSVPKGVERQKIKSVPYFLSKRDEEMMKLLLSNTEKLTFDTLLNEKLFFVEESKIDNLEKYINDVCYKIEKIIQQKVREQILERYRLGATQMGNKAAFLHPIGQERDKFRPFIATVVLKEAVFWEFSEVNLIFIVSLPSINSANRHIYESLSTFMLDDELIYRYEEQATFQHLKMILKQLEEEKWNG